MIQPSRWVGPLQIALQLPEDAVIIPVNKGLVMASAMAGRILKLGRERPSLRREIRARSIIKAAGLSQRVPAILDHGPLSNDGSWMVKELTPNTRPLHEPINPFCDRRRLWRRWLRQEILPMLERFYEASGVETLNVDELLETEKQRLHENNAPRLLWDLAQLAEEARPPQSSTRAVRTMIYGDLKPAHVHRHNGQWWLLDWGQTRRSDISREIFSPYIWKPSRRSADNRAFWAWLRGEASSSHVTKNVQADIQLFEDWHSAWLKISVDERGLRYQTLVALLHDLYSISARARAIRLEALGIGSISASIATYLRGTLISDSCQDG